MNDSDLAVVIGACEDVVKQACITNNPVDLSVITLWLTRAAQTPAVIKNTPIIFDFVARLVGDLEPLNKALGIIKGTKAQPRVFNRPFNELRNWELAKRHRALLVSNNVQNFECLPDSLTEAMIKYKSTSPCMLAVEELSTPKYAGTEYGGFAFGLADISSMDFAKWAELLAKLASLSEGLIIEDWEVWKSESFCKYSIKKKVKIRNKEFYISAAVDRKANILVKKKRGGDECVEEAGIAARFSRADMNSLHRLTRLYTGFYG